MRITTCLNCGMEIFSDVEDAICGKCDENQILRDTVEKQQKEIEFLKHKVEDLYQLGTRADFDKQDWKEFERIMGKQYEKALIQRT